MQINLSTELHTLHGEVMQRPTSAYLKAVARYQILHGRDFLEKLSPEERETLANIAECPMTLGYLVCEALPKTVPPGASEADKVKIAALQRKVVKEGVQDFQRRDLEKMIEGVYAYVAPEFSFLALEAAGLLAPEDTMSPDAARN